MNRYVLSFIALFLSALLTYGQTHSAIVADSLTRKPLPSASLFDHKGNAVGITNARGRMPLISRSSYPVTVRYLGFREKTIETPGADTIFLQENAASLPEIVVESGRHKVLHVLAYVREFSTLTTYTDTVFLFREKMVDFMLNPDRKVRFKGWSNPRILTSRSYYRFTNDRGLDSVSNVSNNHFSWADWIGIVPARQLPPALKDRSTASDTVRGKYSPTEIWTKTDDRVTVDVNVLADTTSRKWVPNLSGFFHDDLEFENFRVRFSYDNILSDYLSPMDLTGYSFNIESNGRGHRMIGFNRYDQPFFVSTYAEAYVLDKEYITVKEARKWEKHDFHAANIEMCEPAEAPELQPSVQALVDRVNTIDRDKVRQTLPTDQRLIGKYYGKRKSGLGTRALSMLKQMTGISSYKSHKNFKQQWNGFKKFNPSGDEK